MAKNALENAREAEIKSFDALARTQLSDVIDALGRIDARIVNAEARTTIGIMETLARKAIRELT